MSEFLDGLEDPEPLANRIYLHLLQHLMVQLKQNLTSNVII